MRSFRPIFFITLLLAAFISPELAKAQETVIDVVGGVGFHYQISSAGDSIFRCGIDSLRLHQTEKTAINERLVSAGKLFLGTPYIDKSLEVGSDSNNVVLNFEGFDCVTFYENAWAMARYIRKYSSSNPRSYALELLKTRYRGGQHPKGFVDRLHYTSDYFYDNAKRGLLKEMTKKVGGEYALLETKKIDFMSKHPDLYKQLHADPSLVQPIKKMEDNLNSRGGFYYIKKENVTKIESGIETGDILGITTSIPGIDCSHTGIAVRGDDGRIHFMHASSAMHKVIITDIPLADYLANNSKQTGIMIYRPQEVGK